MTQTLQNTINFALPFIEYSPLTAGFGQEPAVSIASMIRASLLNAGVGPWYWNRNNQTVGLTMGQQDYVLFAEDFGYLEKCTVADDQGHIWQLKDVHNTNALSLTTEQQRPNAVSVEAGTAGLPAGGTIDSYETASNPASQASTAISISSIAGEGLILVTQAAGIGTTLGTPGSSWAALSGGSGIYTQPSIGSVNVTQTVSPPAAWASIAASFRMLVPGSQIVEVQNKFSSGSISSPTKVLNLNSGTSIGSGLLVFLQIFDVTPTAFTQLSATDDKGNQYFLIGLSNPGGVGGPAVGMLWSPNVAQGTQTITVSFDGSGSGSVGAIEVSGISAPLQSSPLIRFQGSPDQTYTANVIYQKKAQPFGPYFATSVGDADGGNTIYVGSFDPVSFPTNSIAQVTGFEEEANNGSFAVVACTVGSLTLANASGVAESDVTGYINNFSWAPIPDYYSDVYNNLFLSEALALVDDSRAQLYRSRGVAAFLSKAQGLNDMQKNAFVQQWLARNQESATSSLRVQQGVGARGQ